jgi:C-terminal processing protease CtpA/Prc
MIAQAPRRVICTRSGLGRVLVSVVCLGLASQTLAASSCQARREYDEIVANLTQRFYDRTFRGLDWPARVAAHRQGLRCGMDDAAVAARVNGLMAELHASHTAVYTPGDMHYWGLNSFFSADLKDYQLYFSGIWAETQSGRWHARYVLEDSPAARAAVLPGDELIELNGTAFSPLRFTGAEDSLVVSSDGTSRRTTLVRANHEAAGTLRPASELRMHERLREVYDWLLPRSNLAVFLPDWQPDRSRRGTKLDRPGA